MEEYGVLTTTTITTTEPDGTITVVEKEQSSGKVTTWETVPNGIEVTTVDEPGKPVHATATIPTDVESATVIIPATVTPGTVAINADTGEIIQLSVPTDDGMAVYLEHSVNIVLEDRSKSFSNTNENRLNWAQDSIAFVTAHDLFKGTSEDTFDPDKPMTRAMLMTVLAGSTAWIPKAVASGMKKAWSGP